MRLNLILLLPVICCSMNSLRVLCPFSLEKLVFFYFKNFHVSEVLVISHVYCKCFPHLFLISCEPHNNPRGLAEQVEWSPLNWCGNCDSVRNTGQCKRGVGGPWFPCSESGAPSCPTVPRALMASFRIMWEITFPLYKLKCLDFGLQFSLLSKKKKWNFFKNMIPYVLFSSTILRFCDLRHRRDVHCLYPPSMYVGAGGG